MKAKYLDKGYEIWTNSKWPRYLLILFMLSTWFCIQGMMNRVIGIVLVCIDKNGTSTNRSNIGLNLNQNQSITFFDGNNDESKLHWDHSQEANLLSAHFWGQLITLPISAFILKPHTLYLTLLLSVGGASISSALFPLVTAQYGFWGAFLSRAILGTAMGFSTSCVPASIAALIDLKERSFVYSVVMSANQISSVFIDAVVVNSCKKEPFGLKGWTFGFYFLAAIGIFWFLLWLPCKYLYKKRKSTSSTSRDNEPSTSSSSSRDFTYWQLFKSPAFLCLIPSTIASYWTTQFLMFFVPLFFRDVLKISLDKNGLYSSLPFLALCIIRPVYTLFSNWIEKCCRKDSTFSAKVFNTVAFAGSGLFIILCNYPVSKHPDVQIISYVTLVGATFAASAAGFRRSMVSMSVKHAGAISASTTFAAIGGAIVLQYIQAFIVKTGALEEWRTFFIFISIFNFLAAIIYCLFGTTSDKAFTRENSEERKMCQKSP